MMYHQQIITTLLLKKTRTYSTYNYQLSFSIDMRYFDKTNTKGNCTSTLCSYTIDMSSYYYFVLATPKGLSLPGYYYSISAKETIRLWVYFAIFGSIAFVITLCCTLCIRRAIKSATVTTTTTTTTTTGYAPVPTLPYNPYTYPPGGAVPYSGAPPTVLPPPGAYPQYSGPPPPYVSENTSLLQSK